MYYKVDSWHSVINDFSNFTFSTFIIWNIMNSWNKLKCNSYNRYVGTKIL